MIFAAAQEEMLLYEYLLLILLPLFSFTVPIPYNPVQDDPEKIMLVISTNPVSDKRPNLRDLPWK